MHLQTLIFFFTLTSESNKFLSFKKCLIIWFILYYNKERRFFSKPGIKASTQSPKCEANILINSIPDIH